MEVFKKLEDLTSNKPTNKQYLGFAKLSVGFHEILCFRYVKNKYGKKSDGSNKSILIELDNEVLFLPQYFCQQLTQSDLNDLNKSINKNKKMFLYFGGRFEESK